MASAPLRRLVAALESTLPMYVSDSGIWSYPGPEATKLALADLVSDHKSLLDRARTVLAEREVAAPRTAYPLSFTALHDVDLTNLLPRVIDGLKSQIATLETVAAAAGDDATATELAREAVDTNRRHADRLEQLVAKRRAGLVATKP
jgi:peptidoglycan/xylan/chitin deacetylase (PgdA/CDA1 family)